MDWIKHIPLPVLDVIGFCLAVAFVLIPSGIWTIRQNLWKGLAVFAGSFAVLFCGVRILDAEPKTVYALVCGLIVGVVLDLARRLVPKVKP